MKLINGQHSPTPSSNSLFDPDLQGNTRMTASWYVLQSQGGIHESNLHTAQDWNMHTGQNITLVNITTISFYELKLKYELWFYELK